MVGFARDALEVCHETEKQRNSLRSADGLVKLWDVQSPEDLLGCKPQTAINLALTAEKKTAEVFKKDADTPLFSRLQERTLLFHGAF